MGVDFNLSHTDGAAVAGVSFDGQIGVDLERLSRQANAEELAKRFFAPEEQAFCLEPADNAERRRRFFRCWTLKEAYLKAQGTGFAKPLDSFAFRDILAPEPALLYDREGVGGTWRFFAPPVEADYVLSVAVHARGDVDDVRLFRWQGAGWDDVGYRRCGGGEGISDK